MKKLMEFPHKIIVTDEAAKRLQSDPRDILVRSISLKLDQDVLYNDWEMHINVKNTDMHYIGVFQRNNKDGYTYIDVESPFLVTHLHIPLHES